MRNMKDLDEYDEDEFESWQAKDDFYQREDWKGLVSYSRENFEINPNDYYALIELCEALIFNKEYNEVLLLLIPIYKEDHESLEVINLILDSLFGQGKTEKDFAWISEPKIFKLDDKTIKFCLNFLKSKRKRIRIGDLFLEILINDDYVTFNADELYAYLKKDNRFNIIGDETFPEYCEVKLTTKS